MKMTLKGISAAVAFWVAYIDKNFTPLFWVLLGLVILDLVLNAHREGQQFNKIGSMAISLGIPSYIVTNFAHSDFSSLAKYVVAALCLVYLQIVIPALLDKIHSFQFSSNKADNADAQAKIESLVQKVAALEQTQAQKVLDGSKAPEVIQEEVK